MTNKLFMWLLVAAFVAWGSPVLAQDWEDQMSEDIEQAEEELEEAEQEVEEADILETLVPSPDMRLTGPDALANIIVEGGAGVSNFTGELGSALEPGVSWNVRGVIGARSLIGVEVGYFGAVNAVEGQDTGLDVNLTDVAIDGTVSSNSLEGLARINLLDEDFSIKPFVAGGASIFRQNSD